MPLATKNLDWLRNLDPSTSMRELGQKLSEALESHQSAVNTLEQQTNGNVNGDPTPPPPINSLTVTAMNGYHQIQIQDHNEIYRGVRYYVEHDTSPNFTNPQPIYMGDARTANVNLGSGTRYFRAFSAYSPSGPSAPVYHGTSAQPRAVVGGGVSAPEPLPSQSSGTGRAVQPGLSGPGPVPFRSSTGRPPIR